MKASRCNHSAELLISTNFLFSLIILMDSYLIDQYSIIYSEDEGRGKMVSVLSDGTKFIFWQPKFYLNLWQDLKINVHFIQSS